MSKVVDFVGQEGPPPPPPAAAPPFAEMVSATNYSFLRGASHPGDMAGRAVELGHTGIGIADRNTVAGVVRAYAALRKARRELAEQGLPDIEFKLAVGARLVFTDGTPDIVAYPATRRGWGQLTRLLTVGNRRACKGHCILGLSDLLRHAEDLLLIVLPDSSACAVEPFDRAAPLPPPRADPSLDATLAVLTAAAPGRVWLAAIMPRTGRDRRALAKQARLAATMRAPLLATCDALYASPAVRPLHDIVTCIREGVTVAKAGRRLLVNAERHLKSPEEMARLFGDWPDAVAESQMLLNRIGFSLDQLRYEYPHEPVPQGWEPQAWLEHLTWAKARDRYPDGIPDKVRKLLAEEFGIIAERRYAYYFLTVYEAVRYAREERGILCQGRGSAANSVVCFVLGITSVDPMAHNMLFSRFISAERNEPPDIDVDFEHERREEVIQHIYDRYGRHRAGLAATVIHYRPRSAVGEVGKALGLSQDVTQRLTSTVWGSFADHFEDKRFAETGFDIGSREIGQLRDLVGQLLKFPRHLSQHVGGFVLTQDRLDETVPIHNGAMPKRTFIEWDKDDIDELGLMKVDVLALGMLTAIAKSFAMMRAHGLGNYELHTIPQEDPAVYEMLQQGDSIGVFQVESRAQINMLPRLKPKEFYDLAIQVAIVRPGPIEGDMVHPYLRRRSGKETVEFPSPKPPNDPNELRELLGKTYGVPLFQEQAMRLAIVAAGFSPDKANELRKAMATFRDPGTIGSLERDMIEGMVSRGYERHFAERCFGQIKGFGSYGFPESHAVSFALLVYVSSWIKKHHPAVFCAALLNSQPMGFYAPAQLLRDAREHGVEVREIDVNASGWDNGLEPRDGDGHALRLGFRQVDGFSETWAQNIADARDKPFSSIEDLTRRADLPSRALRLLADADAMRSLGRNRREALWEARRTPPKQLALFGATGAPELGIEVDPELPTMPLAEHVATDYQTTRLSLKGHPMAFLRARFRREGVLSAAEANAKASGARVRMAGVVLVRQRPGKGNAIFVTLEDETGIGNVLIWARNFERYRRAVMASRLMLVSGVIQREGIVVHLMVDHIVDRSAELATLVEDDRPVVPLLKTESPDPRGYGRSGRSGHPRNVRILPASRDFH